MDIWRCAIVHHPIETIGQTDLQAESITWLPDMPRHAFRADPFGIWRDGRLHVFTEVFDYRTRRGHIDLLVYDESFSLLDCRTILQRPWHLSYPQVFESEGQVWMFPEAYRSGTLTLYRARDFPGAWEAVCDIALDGPAIDATPLFHQGRWWLFYAPSHSKTARLSHLHVAWAEALTGPWRVHPNNPVRIDRAGARPGGTARHSDGGIILPVQDCTTTYGGAVAALWIDRLDETGFSAIRHPYLRAPQWMLPFTDGLHTLAAAGPVCLIDVKRQDASLSARSARLMGIARRACGI